MAIPIRALIVEDSESDCTLLLGMLQRGGYEVTHKRVCSADALIASLDQAKWDIVISDYFDAWLQRHRRPRARSR